MFGRVDRVCFWGEDTLVWSSFAPTLSGIDRRVSACISVHSRDVIVVPGGWCRDSFGLKITTMLVLESRERTSTAVAQPVAKVLLTLKSTGRVEDGLSARHPAFASVVSAEYSFSPSRTCLPVSPFCTMAPVKRDLSF